jgi:predicted small lipoprotein YifL
MKAIRLVLASAALGALGCGQKGPLYLPDHNGAVVTRPAGASQGSQPATQQPAQRPKTDAVPPGTATPGTATPNGATPKKSSDKDDDGSAAPNK